MADIPNSRGVPKGALDCTRGPARTLDSNTKFLDILPGFQIPLVGMVGGPGRQITRVQRGKMHAAGNL